jgi:hypothetical protein
MARPLLPWQPLSACLSTTWAVVFSRQKWRLVFYLFISIVIRAGDIRVAERTLTAVCGSFSVGQQNKYPVRTSTGA